MTERSHFKLPYNPLNYSELVISYGHIALVNNTQHTNNIVVSKNEKENFLRIRTRGDLENYYEKKLIITPNHLAEDTIQYIKYNSDRYFKCPQNLCGIVCIGVYPQVNLGSIQLVHESNQIITIDLDSDKHLRIEVL